MNVKQEDAEAIFGLGVLALALPAGAVLSHYASVSWMLVLILPGLSAVVFGLYHDDSINIVQNAKPTDAEVANALVALDRLRAQEPEYSDKEEIDHIRRTISAVYEVNRSAPENNELDQVKRVLRQMDSSDVDWADAKTVREAKRRGLSWVQHGKQATEVMEKT